MFPFFPNLQQSQNYYFDQNLNYYPQISLLYNLQTPYYSNFYGQQNIEYRNINSGGVRNIKQHVSEKQRNQSEEQSQKSNGNYKRIGQKCQDDYEFKAQNTQRNIISNIAHHLMCFFKKGLFISELVESVIKTHNINLTSDQFFVILKKIKLRNYVRKVVLEDLWKNNQNPQFTKIFRILSYKFLKENCFSSILHSKKINKDLKLHHLPKIRQLSILICKPKAEYK